MNRVERLAFSPTLEAGSAAAGGQESEMLARLQQGDSRAADWFLNRYGKEIFHFVYRFLGNAEDARDAAQQSLLKALQHAGQFDPRRGKPRSWLFKIAANHCLNELKKRGRLREKETSLDSGADVTLEIDQANCLAVREALASLEPRDRQIVVLIYYHGFTYREIGAMLDLRLGTVKSRLSRALQKLRTHFR